MRDYQLRTVVQAKCTSPNEAILRIFFKFENKYNLYKKEYLESRQEPSNIQLHLIFSNHFCRYFRSGIYN